MDGVVLIQQREPMELHRCICSALAPGTRAKRASEAAELVWPRAAARATKRLPRAAARRMIRICRNAWSSAEMKWSTLSKNGGSTSGGSAPPSAPEQSGRPLQIVTVSMMAMRLALTWALLVASAQACCPNLCSGHGVCNQFGNGCVCSCFAGYWGGDCSRRATQRPLTGMTRVAKLWLLVNCRHLPDGPCVERHCARNGPGACASRMLESRLLRLHARQVRVRPGLHGPRVQSE